MYLRVALRTLRREKLYATLNIAGFALGIGACLILGPRSSRGGRHAQGPSKRCDTSNAC